MNQLTKSGPFVAIIKLWEDLKPAQRVVVIAFVTVSIVAVVLIAMYASKTKNSVLFSGLSSEDAGAIVGKLSEQKIPYTLSGDGSTIEVPEDKVYDLRLKMATDGLPQGGNVGFELFDKQSFGMTEFTEKLNFQRAIQGELTRTISSLAPVMGARVHIVLPQDKVFESEQNPTTASVVLKLRNGTPLSDDQIGGIVHLVASSVEGLKPENITVTDSKGNMLSDSTFGGGAGLLTNNQTKLKRQYENQVASNLQSMLAQVVGADKAVVRVSAEMSFDKKQVQRESFEPGTGQGNTGKGIITQEQNTIETYNGAVIPPSGVPTNMSKNAQAGDNYKKSQTSAEYQVTKQVENIDSAPGTITRLSVSVLVDDKVDATKIAALKEAVISAAGIDPARNDQVTVQRIAFDTSAQTAMDKEMKKASKTELMMTLAKNGGAVLLLIVFLVFLRSILKQVKVQSPAKPLETTSPEVVASAPLPSPAEMIQRATEQAFPENDISQSMENYATAATPEKLPSVVAQSSPEDLAKLVRGWINE